MRGHSRRQEMIKGMVEKLQIESEGKAITVRVSAILKGSRPRTFSYTATAAVGQSGMTSKWNMHMTCERTSRKICIDGSIRIPPFSIWKLNDIRSEVPVFRFHNSLGSPMIELSKLAEIVRRQSTVLDVYDYKISYVNVGRQVSRVSRKVLDALELVLLPYHVSKDSYSSSGVSRLP